MTIMNGEKPSLDELTHHGVKGQKWGVIRRSESGGSEARIKKLNRKLGKLDGNRIISGSGLHNWGVEKFGNRDNVDAIVMRRLALRGALETAIVIGGTHLVAKNLKLNNKNRLTAIAIIGGQAGKMSIDNLRNLRQFKKQDDIRAEIRRLEKEMKKRKKP